MSRTRRMRLRFSRIRRWLATALTFATVASGLAIFPVEPSQAVLPTLNDNTAVFQITFTGITALPNQQTLVSPVGLQAAWTKGTQPTDSDWIDITSTPSQFYTRYVPISGSHGGVTATVPTGITASDTIQLTIRDNPTDAIAGDLAGFVGSQPLSVGQRPDAPSLGGEQSAGNPNVKELISFGQFPGFKYLQDAFSKAPSTFVISAKLPATVTDLSFTFGTNSGNMQWNSNSIAAWDVSHVTTFEGMFYSNQTFNQDLSTWDTSSATNFKQMFQSARDFNGNITNWNTANVTDMTSMFNYAAAFNQDIGSWNTSNLTAMVSMFQNASAFNKSLNSWNTAKVTDMSQVFQAAAAFNGDIGNWNTSSVTKMVAMFRQASVFNKSIGNWDTSSVTDMNTMFFMATNFNQAIGNWNTANVTNMSAMFSNAVSFNQPIGSWNTGNVTTMQTMFQSASSFNQSLDTWNVAKVTTFDSMFYSAPIFNQPLNSWNIASATTLTWMFKDARAFNRSLNSWNTSSVLRMDAMFSGAIAFNGDISSWSPSKVTNMSSMFYGATNFNIDISGWNTSKVTTMNSMFYQATSFNKSLSSWNTARVLDMGSMFYGATTFNGDISGWDTGDVMKMDSMFYGASHFNIDISSWNTGRVLTMYSMFYGATAFNQPIGQWDTRFVTSMYAMFAAAPAFNQPIGEWNTERVTDMSYMFSGATSFNSSVSGWNVSNVTGFTNTFTNASSFNQSLNSWTPLSAISRPGMLTNANSFNQPLFSFPITLPSGTSSSTGSTFMLPSSMSQANTEETLATWANQIVPNPSYIQLASNLKWYTDCRSYAAYQRIAGIGNLSKSGGATNPAAPTGCTTTSISWSPSQTNTSPSIANGVLTFTPSPAPTGSNDIRFSSRTRECMVNPITGSVSYKSTATACVIRAWDNDPNGSMDYADVTFSTLTKYTVPGMVYPNTRPTETGWNLYWTAPASSGSFPVTNYLVKDPTSGRIYCYVPATELSCDVSNLNLGQGYNIYYYAVSDAGLGVMNYTNSNYDIKPGAPTITSVVPGSGLSLDLNFTAGTALGTPTSSYEYSTNGGTNWKTATLVSSTALNLPNQSLSTAFVGGTTYNIMIRAKNQYTTSDASASAQGTPLDRQIGAPTITSYTAAATTLNVTATAPPLTGSAISSYEYSTDGGSTWRARASGTTAFPIAITTKSSDNTAIVENTEYLVQIRAVTGAGSGLPSASFSMKSNRPPTAPTGVSGTQSGSAVTVSWTASTVGLGITYTATSTPGGFTCTAVAPTTTCDISGLTYGTSYTFTVRATNTATSTTSTASAAIVPDVAPDAPTITSIRAASQQLSINFTAGGNSGSALTKYMYSTDGGSTWRQATGLTSPFVITTISGGANTTLVDNQSYTVKIYAFNTRAGAASNSVSAKPNASLLAPTSPTATLSGADVRISWTAPVGYVDSYSVVSTPSGFDCTVNSPATHCDLTGLTAGVTFTFRVTATNSSGTSPESVATVGVTPDPAPGAPFIFSIGAGNKSLSITFVAGTNTGSAISKYQYSTDEGGTWKDASGLTSPLVITQDSSNSELVNGQTYSVQIRAVNSSAGESSSAVSSTPEVLPGAPTLNSVTIGGAQASLNFTAGTNSGSAITKYQYTTDGHTWLDAPGVTSPITITQDSLGALLVNGVTYNVKLRASNTAAGAESAALSFTPEVAPAAPSITSVSLSDKTISVYFTAGANSGSALTNYQYSTDGGSTWRNVNAVISPIHIRNISGAANTSLVNGVSYHVKLRAFNTLAGTATETNPAVPDTAPESPVPLRAEGGDRQLSVTFRPGTNIGSALTKYQYSTDNRVTWRDFTFTTLPRSEVTVVLTQDSNGEALINGSTVTIHLRVWNTMASSASQGLADTVDVIVGAPTITSVTAGDSQLEIAFAPGANLGGSQVQAYQYSTNGGSIWKRATGTTSPLTISTTSNTNTALVNGETYDIQIRAVNQRSGLASAISQGTPNVAPGAPTISSISTSSSQLLVDFTPGTNNGSAITTYQYSTDGGATWRARATGTTGSPLVITRTSASGSVLVNGTTYAVQLRAVNTLYGDASTSTEAIPNTVPSAVFGLAGVSGDGEVSLSWLAPATGSITDYLVEYSTGGGSWETFTHSASNSTSLTVTGLTNGTPYSFRVAGINMTTVGLKTSTAGTITPKAAQSPLTFNLTSTSLSTGSSLTLTTEGGSGSGQVVYSAGPDCTVVNNILTVGNAGSSCIVSATKLADATHRSIDANDVTITVTKIDQLSVPSFSNASTMVYGKTLTLKAAGGTGPGALTYSVTDAGTTGCVVNSNTGLLTVSSVGQCEVGAYRAASTNYNLSELGTQTITVTAAAQTTTFTSNLPTLPLAGATYRPVASTTSGLPVSFTIVLGDCEVIEGTVHFIGAGACTVKGSSAASTNYLAATDVFQTIFVGQRNQVLTFSSGTIAVTQKTFGDAPFLVSANSTEADATVTYKVGSATTNSACSVGAQGLVIVLAVGSCVVEAESGAGSAYSAASNITRTLEILPDFAAAPFVTSTSAGNQSLTISYFAPNYTGGTEVTGYQVEVIPQTGATPTLVESGCGTELTNGVARCTIRGLENGVAYRARVAAINAAGVGTFSGLGEPATAATNPSAVQELHVVESNSMLEIGWSDPDSLGGGVFSEYRIFIKPSTNADYDSNYFAIDSFSTHTFSTSQLPNTVVLENGVGYDIKILTVTTANSLELTANTAVVNQIPRTVPDAPRLAAALLIGRNVVVTWETPLSDGGAPISAYDVVFAGSSCTAAVGAETVCSFPLPTANGSYGYQVSATNVAGRGEAAVGSLRVSNSDSGSGDSGDDSSGSDSGSGDSGDDSSGSDSGNVEPTPNPSEPEEIPEDKGPDPVDKPDASGPTKSQPIDYLFLLYVLPLTALALFGAFFILAKRRKSRSG